MDYLTLIIIGGVAVGLGIYFGRKRANSNSLISKQAKEKQENKEKILKFLQENEKITNDNVEKLCEVSHATAERYLDQLEKEGKLTQQGEIGANVFYTLR